LYYLIPSTVSLNEQEQDYLNISSEKIQLTRTFRRKTYRCESGELPDTQKHNYKFLSSFGFNLGLLMQKLIGHNG
jgi:hypothetical protein